MTPTNENEDIDAVLDNMVSQNGAELLKDRKNHPSVAEAKASLERIMNRRVIEELNSLQKHYHSMDGGLLLVIEERMAELTRQLDIKETT